MKRLCLALAFAVLPAVAHAGIPCAERGKILERITEDYDESRRGAGLGPEVLMELYTNPETRSWTLLLVFPDGRACLLGSGWEWHEDKTGEPA